jgi:hypothetical protein
LRCSLCGDKREVLVVGDDSERPWPCPRCRLKKFQVRNRAEEWELAEARAGFKLGEYLEHQVRQKLVYEIIDHIGEVVRETTLTRTGPKATCVDFVAEATLLIPKGD